MAILPRQIDVLLYEDFNLLDVAGPAQAFSIACKGGAHAYKVRYISIEGKAVNSSCGLPVLTDRMPLRARLRSDLLIPGGQGVDPALGCKTIRRYLKSFSLGTDYRMISVCSGALLLADAGILNGRNATTHWVREKTVLRHYPQVNWSLDKIFVRDGSVYTSAGVTTGIDLSLEIIREDCGAVETLAVARELVVLMKRPGGQAQYTDLLECQLCEDDVVAELVSQLQTSPTTSWTLQTMADKLGTTPRTLSRKCSAATGMSPIKLLEKTRVKLASDMLSDRLPKNRVMRKTGFSNEQSMQRGFKRHLGITVGEYTKKFVPG